VAELRNEIYGELVSSTLSWSYDVQFPLHCLIANLYKFSH